MRRWWKGMTLSKKLYCFIAVIAVLIAVQCLTVMVATDTLTAVRALIYGESLWVKAHKNAIQQLHMYALTSNPEHYNNFKKYLLIPAGDRVAREELEKPHPDMAVVRKGFLQGHNHSDDIPPGVRLLTRYSEISYIKAALAEWRKGDELIAELRNEGQKIHDMIVGVGTVPMEVFHRIDAINNELNIVEKNFAETLGAGARWIESILVALLTGVVLTLGAFTILFLSLFGQSLSRALKELSAAATDIGNGNLNRVASVSSEDEIGDLATALNTMSRKLKVGIEETKAAQSVSATKTLFLANMSHEIRTPLGVILGLTEILRSQNLEPKEHRSYLDLIDTTGQRLSRIINDILDLSKVEAGHLEIEFAPFAPKELLDEIHQMLKIRADERNIELAFCPLGPIPDEIVSDKTRLHQILVNLVSNAIKFTERGRVTLEYQWLAPYLQFRVKDTGIGISPKQQSALFKVFSQADESTTRRFGGTGLGLVLAKKFAQALGGDATLETSALGQGTSFLVTIKPEAERSRRQKPLEVPALLTSEDLLVLEGKRVLIVDDSPENQVVVRHFLKSCKLVLDSADDGLEGLMKARVGKYDLIIMDMQMPRMDGYTATEKLRASGFTQPIIALTAHAMKEDRQRCLAAGCDDYITKPVNSPTLLRALVCHILAASKHQSAPDPGEAIL